jgi:ribosome-binding factor A
MTFRKISRKDLHSACDVPGPGDGLDPRLERKEESPRVKNRKALQLCGQVAETLGLVLAGECDDDLLRDLLVESVVPYPTSVRLLVTLLPAVSAAGVSAAQYLERVQRVQGKLRAEVARAIHRRKAPELLFRVREPCPDGR